MIQQSNRLVLAVASGILFLMPSTSSYAAFDEALAQRWAAESLKIGEGANNDKAAAALSSDWPVVTVSNAWRSLKRCRDAGNSLDLNLAAAEHYMFMRFRASDSGDTVYRNLPRWYNTAKSAATWANVEQYLQTSDQPLSPTDPGVLKWGEKGVERGLKEYEARTGKKPSAGGNALLAAMALAYGQYYYKPAGAYDKLTGACTVKEPK